MNAAAAQPRSSKPIDASRLSRAPDPSPRVCGSPHVPRGAVSLGWSAQAPVRCSLVHGGGPRTRRRRPPRKRAQTGPGGARLHNAKSASEECEESRQEAAKQSRRPEATSVEPARSTCRHARHGALASLRACVNGLQFQSASMEKTPRPWSSTARIAAVLRMCVCRQPPLRLRRARARERRKTVTECRQ